MGCVSSKILTKSGSFQDANQSFQRSNLIEEIILSNSKSTGDQFLTLLCTASPGTRRIKDGDRSPAAAAAAEPAKIETINVSELLAGLEEEQEEEPRQEPTTGRATSFRTVEEIDALVGNRSPEPEEQAAAADSAAVPAGAKRRARARELAELKVPAFDFCKSGTLRDWLLRGGQIFSPGSYVTPKFGSAAAAPGWRAGEQHAVFDPELVAQFERAMEQLSMEEENILKEIVEVSEEEEEERGNEPVLGQA